MTEELAEAEGRGYSRGVTEGYRNGYKDGAAAIKKEYLEAHASIAYHTHFLDMIDAIEKVERGGIVNVLSLIDELKAIEDIRRQTKIFIYGK